MVVRSVDFLEGVTAVPSDVWTDDIQQVCVTGVNHGHRHAVDVVRETDTVGSTHTRRRGVAIQVSARRRLINVEESGQVDSIVPIITDV